MNNKFIKLHRCIINDNLEMYVKISLIKMFREPSDVEVLSNQHFDIGSALYLHDFDELIYVEESPDEINTIILATNEITL